MLFKYNNALDLCYPCLLAFTNIGTLYNDLLGDIPIEWPSIENGYYVSNIDPISLRTNLQKALEDNQNMTSAMKNKLTKLKNAITDNDNNYIIYGKLKR